MPLQQTSGNVTQDAYGGGAAYVPTYIEQLFSTYLYAGTQATQSITNNLTLSTSVALVWIKNRNSDYSHALFDTVRGALKLLSSNTTYQQYTRADSLTSFNTNGFTLGADTVSNLVNIGGNSYVSWSFIKQKNFFDIQTYTGTGSTQAISHNLGSTPGCIFIKRIDTGPTDWAVYHKGLNGGTNPQNYVIRLDTADAQTSDSTYWNNTAPTSTNFTIATNNDVNVSGGTYIAYLFGAGGTGGFGLTGTQDIISCGKYTGANALQNVNLGWEPQWILVKNTTNAGNDWFLQDTMRGMSQTFTSYLNPDNTSIEASGGPFIIPTATGFSVPNTGAFNTNGSNYIYIAIRRGPMAVPTDPTTVFKPVVQSVTSTPAQVNTGFVTDFVSSNYIGGGNPNTFIDRLRGSSSSGPVAYFQGTSTTNAETVTSGQVIGFGFDNETGYIDNYWYTGYGAGSYVYWNFARAPGFFDEVCYTGTGSATTQAHNLGVVPQMIIAKSRSTSSTNWIVYNNTIGNSNVLYLNTTAASTSNNSWNNTSPTSTVFSVFNSTNNSGQTFAAYLFATLAGVSYVGSYTGNGTGQSIACGFGASGARFILIKRTDSTGNWYVFDSANGLTSSSSPYLLWNSGAAQVTGNHGVYASSGGFTFGSTASTTTNISTASYIFLAIA